MDVAIIGLANSGKTTVFDALTGGHAGSSGGDAKVGVVKVADPRLEVLAEMYQPKKTVYAEIRYWDSSLPDSPSKRRGIGGRYRNVMQGAHALLLVVRSFTNPTVAYPAGGLNPGRDLEAVLEDLALADLEVLEGVAERLQDGIKKSTQAERPALVSHLDVAMKVKAGLEEGRPLRSQQLTDFEAAYLADYQLLTSKPVIVVLNTDETSLQGSLGHAEQAEQLQVEGEAVAGLPVVSLCGRLEADLASMTGPEAEEFRREMALGEPAVSQAVRACYEALGLVSFLTAGEQEVRAWSVPAGIAAVQAAGVIHSDFERGFIRAEVIHYDDLVRCGGIAAGRREGVLRSEGKTYGVKDGDVINFLVNV